MKLKLFIFISVLVFGFALSQSKAEMELVKSIDQYWAAIDKDPKVSDYQFKVKGKRRIITYKYSKKANEVLEISREWKENSNNWEELHNDSFLLKNGERVFASQSITYTNMSNKEDVMGWSVSFWMNKNKVMNMTSLGHGKTEMDDWDYEKELKDNFNFMLKTVKEFDKNRLAKIK